MNRTLKIALVALVLVAGLAAVWTMDKGQVTVDNQDAGTASLASTNTPEPPPKPTPKSTASDSSPIVHSPSPSPTASHGRQISRGDPSTAAPAKPLAPNPQNTPQPTIGFRPSPPVSHDLPTVAPTPRPSSAPKPKPTGVASLTPANTPISPPQNTPKPTAVPRPSSSQTDNCQLTILGVRGDVILPPTTVGFAPNETVFDALNRTCRAQSIPLVFKKTVGTVYIEGIGNLFEFDHGGLSGWMFKVNDVFSVKSCADILLANGDVVVFCYTCDMGADVGNIWRP